MGAVNPLFFGEEEGRSVELVQKIIQKTREGKIRWRKSSTGISAVAAELKINFVLSTGMLAIIYKKAGWQLFTVRDQADNEILKVQNPSGLGVIMTGPSQQLSEKIEQLFDLVAGSTRAEIDKAISQLDKI